MSVSLGYLKLYRDIKDNPLWNDKPFSKGQAWIDLLLRANFKDNDVLIGAEIVKVKRGSFITSELKLADEWGWSRKRVRSFLGTLRGTTMVTTKGTTKYTTVTIVNYDFHQGEGTTDGTSKGTSKGQQRDTNKNVKERKEEKKKEIDPFLCL